ncbi:hypothetical protein KA005_82195 [bacterium]|nr:hypothetical protein [bacterium]
MDLLLINTVISLVSAVLMLVAIIYILTYVLGSFSSKSGTMSLKSVLYSLLYFFGSTAFIFIVIEWLTGLSRTEYINLPGRYAFALNIGAGALAMNGVLHIFCGFLTAVLYLKGRIS